MAAALARLRVTPRRTQDGGRHPAWIAAALFAALCIAAIVTYPLHEPDFWQHLLVGRAIWTRHAVPRTMIWTWPTYGAPAITPSWGFRMLIHPFWAIAGVWGLFAWRWLTTLAAFAVVLATTRRTGARGFLPLVVIVMGALAWRDRSQVRPESIAAVLMAIELWILETRRRGGPDRTPWLLPLAWAWINCHVSYHLGLAILGAYVIDAAFGRPREGSAAAAHGRGPALRLVLIGAGMFAVSFLNPYGWRALWSPFEFLLHESREPIYVTIGELQPIRWSENLWNGAPALIFGWPLLALLRVRRRGIDWVEVLLALLFVPLAVRGARFLGFLAIVGTPFLARNIVERFRAAAARMPRAAWTRAAITCAACVAIAVPEWIALPPGIGIVWERFPVRACDFIAVHGVRGRGYNTFSFGGYLLWRFWPERDRLPFMDIHQSGTPEDRRLYSYSLERPEYWHRLDDKYQFEWALLARRTFAADRLPDFIDADSTWALVFQDDAALLFARRAGPMAEVARRWAYAVAPAGNSKLAFLAPRLARDPALRARLRADLERVIRESHYASHAHELLANVDLLERNPDAARAEIRAGLAADPENEDLRRRMRELAER